MSFDKEKILGAAQKYILKGQSKKAVKELQKLVEATPRDSRLRLKLGDLYLKNGENENALREFLKVAELYEEEDLNLRAISIYKKILSVNPNYVEALHRIGKLYMSEGLEGSAKNCYQTILKIKPDDEEALSALERFNHDHPSGEGQKPAPLKEPALPQQRQPPQHKTTSIPPPGRAVFPLPPEKGKEEAPPSNQDSETHYHLGIAYKEMELFDYAINEFEAASEDPSISFDCYIMLGTCHMERGDYAKAIDYYKQASKIEGLPDDKLARLHFNLGLAYEASGMTSEALDTFNLVLKLDRSFAEAGERIKKLQVQAK